MDISSEFIHSLLPVFMVSTLGASMTTVGLVEGFAEASASITKVFSGVISDRLGKRKALAVFGYGLAALTKPVFAMANSIGWVFGARFADRIGKGIRGAPRDALVADLTPAGMRGAAYGLRQTLDSVGAFIGPLLAMVAMAWLANNIRAALWFAVFPSFIAVAVLLTGVREPAAAETGKAANTPITLGPITLAALKRLPFHYWHTVALSAVFTLARFSEAFLILRAQDVGISLGRVPAILIVMNIAYAASSYPAGAAADRLPPRRLLILGLAILALADIFLARAATPAGALAGAGLWGIHMGLTHGLFAKLVADASPAELRGSAFGVFNLATGMALLAASLIAGALWNAFGAGATFLTGAGFAAVAALGLILYRNEALSGA